MNRVGAAGAGGSDYRIRIQVAARGFGRADKHGLIGDADVQRTGIGLGIDRDGSDSEPPRRAYYPERYFATIGDEQLGYRAIAHSDCERSTCAKPLGTSRITAARCARADTFRARKNFSRKFLVGLPK
ncbi:MAG TPA: hypothetical protein VKT27_10785 [Candidatus Binataceae bacterium]|nr:hypothetical protein [Candidatus Binataceae bacterium]